MIKTNIGIFNSLEDITNFENVKEIYINNKGLKHLPKIIKDFWNLEILDLSNEYFGYDEWNKNDIGLQNWLGISDEDFSIYSVNLIPDFVYDEYNYIFTEGNILTYNLNQISYLPDEIANLQKLKILNLSNAYEFNVDFSKENIFEFQKHKIKNYYLYNDKLIIIDKLYEIPDMKNIRLINILNQEFIKDIDFFYPDSVEILQINYFCDFDFYISPYIKVLYLFNTKDLEPHFLDTIREIKCYNKIEIYFNNKLF
jgi:hypothetical protein